MAALGVGEILKSSVSRITKELDKRLKNSFKMNKKRNPLLTY